MLAEPASPQRHLAKARYRANVEAIRFVQQRDVEDRAATVEERRGLARWSCWGAIAQVFDDTQPGWSTAYAELKSLLDDDAYRAARRTTTNAHYTSPEITTQMWSALEQLGLMGESSLNRAAGRALLWALRQTARG